MKIEKINENQIKCTLNKDDLTEHQLKLSELAYGTEKANALLREMMDLAETELDFHAKDLPLMIEAIPMSNDSITLIVTKVKDPDTWNHSFAELSVDDYHDFDDDYDDYDDYDDFDDMDDYPDDIEGITCDDSDTTLLDIFHQVRNKISALSSESTPSGKDFVPLAELLNAASRAKPVSALPGSSTVSTTRVFSFDNLNSIIHISNYIKNYRGRNSLLKCSQNKRYYLIMNNTSQSTAKVFTTLCNLSAEFGKPENDCFVSEAYYREHFDVIIENKALQKLNSFNQ